MLTGAVLFIVVDATFIFFFLGEMSCLMISSGFLLTMLWLYILRGISLVVSVTGKLLSRELQSAMLLI